MGKLAKIKWWIILALALLLVAGFVLSLIAKPGSPFFRLKKMRESLVGKTAAFSVARKANYALGITTARINEFGQIETNADPLTGRELAALAETQVALNAAQKDVKNVKIRFNSANTQIKSSEVANLLTRLSDSMKKQLEIIDKLQKRTSDSDQLKKLGEDKKEVKSWSDDAEADKADLEDDQKLNNSLALPKIEASGQIKSEGDNLKLAVNSTAFAIISSQYNLKDYENKFVQIEGTLTAKGLLQIESLEAQLTAPLTQVVDITASGTLTEKKAGLTLTKKNQSDYILESGKTDLTQYIDKFVEVRGEIEKNKITVTRIKFK